MEKILIVDDSQLYAAQLKVIIGANYEVAIARTAEDGLRKARSEEFSLILLDVVMPEMDGFTLLKKLQEENMTQDVPVILITSLSDVLHEQQGLVLGAVDYITKPFVSQIVEARVNTHIKLYQYRRQIKRQSMTDELTGVANRRRYEQYSKRKWNEAIRLRQPFSICMFDIDKFKAYNDKYGHPAGDEVLTAVAQTVASKLQRSTDFFARYGGEEFVGIFLGEDGERLYKHLQKIRQAIEDLRIPHDPAVGEWVTVSIGGVTVVPETRSAYDVYFRIADTMLYDAKKRGRNMVVWADEKMREIWGK